MNNNLTILYITSNREDEVFEQKIRNKLLEVTGDHPIVSISQKPIDFGHNICVGDVGSTYRNAFIQLHIGANYAKTEYVAIAEADELYPPGYFDFKPKNDLYMNKKLYILRHWDRSRFWQKEYGDWTVIVRKQLLIQRLKLHLRGSLEWGHSKLGATFQRGQWEYFDVGAPIISIKTPRNISISTDIRRDLGPLTELPHWGSAADLSKYLNLWSYYHEWRNSKKI